MTAWIDRVEVTSFVVPTKTPEADGTLRWDSTTLVLVEARSGNVRGYGYTYADKATAALIHDRLIPLVTGREALGVSASWLVMMQAVRNLGRSGITAMAVAAVDNALWDLKARLLELPLVTLLGQIRQGVQVYGSGGFTSYSTDELQDQLSGWASQGIRRVKMKVGTSPEDDPFRVQAARDAIGPGVELFVDANGAYSRKQALAMAGPFAASGVSWFEEPVPADDVAGLCLLRDRLPGGMDLAVGEYGYQLGDFQRLLTAGAVDVLQADATRCCGITGFLHVGALCQTAMLPLSAHTAPAVHAHVACAVPAVRHIEWFYDHVRIEQQYFDGVLEPVAGELVPDRSRPGMGFEPKRADLARFVA